MGWETTNFTVERNGELARVFNFEITFTGEASHKERMLRGDGLILRDGTVRFNRPDTIKQAVEGSGINPEFFLTSFADWVLTHTAPQLAAATSG